MSRLSESTIRPVFNFISFQKSNPISVFIALIVGSFFLTLSSYINIPMIPVPISMQTLAVTLLGALCGWRLGGMIITVWLFEGALGLPVFAGGAGGLYHFLGPTAGYLVSFPIAGMLMGWLAGQGWNGNSVFLAFIGMIISHGCCLLFGAVWLATIIGYKQSLILGVMPFLAGEIVKSALGAMTLKFLNTIKVQ